MAGRDLTDREDEDASGEVVRLGLPAGGPCAALARAVVVALGRQAGFGRSTLGSLALAVDETLVLVLPTTDAGVDLEVVVRPGALGVTVRGRRPHTSLDAGAVTRFAEAAGALVTTLDVDASAVLVRLDVGTTDDAHPPTA